MQAHMQAVLPQGSQVPSSLGERRSISHDLARFSLDLSLHHKSANQPYPSPPMSHSPPPPSPNSVARQHQTAAITPLYDTHCHRMPLVQVTPGAPREPYRYVHDPRQVQQPTPTSAPADREAFPLPFSPLGGADLSHRAAPPAGRTPFVAQPFTPAPQAPRRPKSHVASACVNCKKAHLACDTRRPCPRCVGLGKQDTCVDVQHKKRGRPRLRDERIHSFEVAQMNRRGVGSPLAAQLAAANVHSSYRSNTHRVLKSQSAESRRPSLTPRDEAISQVASYFDQQNRSSRNLPPLTDATAYLTVELTVAKSTESLRDLLGYGVGELDGVKSLFNIVLHTDIDKVHQLSSRIQEDLRHLEPKPPCTPAGVYNLVQTIGEAEAAKSTHASRPHLETLHIRRPDGQYLRIRTQAKLAINTAYFVVVVFTLANEMPPPLQLSSSAPATASHFSILGSSPAVAPAPLASPSFLAGTPHHRQLQSEPSGPQSPYAQGQPISGIQSTNMEARPRTLQPDSPYGAPFSAFINISPSPATSTFPRGQISPAPAATSVVPRSQTKAIPQNDLQLPPILLKPSTSNVESALAREGLDAQSHVETPRRERIGVKEMLE